MDYINLNRIKNIRKLRFNTQFGESSEAEAVVDADDGVLDDLMQGLSEISFLPEVERSSFYSCNLSCLKDYR